MDTNKELRSFQNYGWHKGFYSPMRENLTFIVNIIPIGQAIQYNEWVVPLFDPLNVRILMGEEEKLLITMPFYSIGTTIVLLAGAYVIFRKKDFK